jgi:hypothetical protein
MLECDFEVVGESLLRCRACGREVVTTSPPYQTHAVCRDQTSRFQLGDQLEVALTAIGITKESYRKAKQVLGLPPTCNCDKRKEWLNQMGQRLQVSADKLRGIYDEFYAKPR